MPLAEDSGLADEEEAVVIEPDLSWELAPDEEDEFYRVVFAMQRFICDAETEAGYAKVPDEDLFKRKVDWETYWLLSRSVDHAIKTSLEAVGSGEAQSSEVEEVLHLLKERIANEAAHRGDPHIRRSSAEFLKVLNREPCHSTLLKMIAAAVERKTRTRRETHEARMGPFSDNCGFSKASPEVKAFAEVKDGEERAIYELMQNICDHMKELGKVVIVYEDGTTEDFNGLQQLTGPKKKKVTAIEFIDDGKGVNPDNFLSVGHFAEEGARTLGQHGKGMKIACAYLCCIRLLQIMVEAVQDGQEWEARLVERSTKHKGPVPLMHIDGVWKSAPKDGKRGTKITILNPDEKFLRALEKMPNTFLYASPHYRGAKLVKSLCPGDFEFIEQRTEPGKVECLLGLKRGGDQKYYSALRGLEGEQIPGGTYNTVHVDGLDLQIGYHDIKALLPWAVEGFGGDEVAHGRKVKRAHNSVYIEGSGLNYLIPSAVRSSSQRPLLKYLIEQAENQKESLLEFPERFYYDKPGFDDQTKGLVLSIFKELHGEAEITLDEELGQSEGLVCIKNTGLFNFLSEAGVPITKRLKEKAKERKVVKKEREQRVAFAYEEEALEKMVQAMARVEDAQCDLKEYKGKGVLHLSIPGLAGDEEMLNGNDENDLVRVLSIAAIVANKKQIPLKIFCTRKGQRLELNPKTITGSHPDYTVKWEVTIEELEPEAEDDDFEKGKTHLLFEGAKINDMYERSVLGMFAPDNVDTGAKKTGLERVLAAFLKAFKEVQVKVKKAANLSLKSNPKADFNPSFEESNSPYCVEEDTHSESVWYPGAPNQGSLEREVGPRMERGIDLEESILSPGFYTEQILSKPVLSAGRLTWKNKGFQGESISLPSKTPKEWASKIVMRNLRPGYRVLPMRNYDTLLAVEDQDEEDLDILRDAATGSFCVLVKPPGLKKLTYYTGSSPKKYPNPTVDTEDQEDVLNYDELDDELKGEIHAIRKSGPTNFGKKARAVQKSWGEGFTYDPRHDVNAQTRGETLEEAATRTLNLRRGNCGFAATGAVLFDRAVGVPSQYIAGFEVDSFGMGEGHAKVRFWDGTSWKIREPQTGCTKYEGPGRSLSPKTEPVNVKQSLPDATELVEAGNSLFTALSAYRGRLLAGLLATGLLGWSTYETLQSGAPEAVMSALAEHVNLKGVEPTEVEGVRERIRQAVCGDEEKNR